MKGGAKDWQTMWDYADLPEKPPGNYSDINDFRVTNSGIYCVVGYKDPNPEPGDWGYRSWFVRLPLSRFKDSQFYIHKDSDKLSQQFVLQTTNESDNNFSIIAYDHYHYRYINANNDLPHSPFFKLSENAWVDEPQGWTSLYIARDRSEYPSTWCFVSSAVKIEQNNNSGKWDTHPAFEKKPYYDRHPQPDPIGRSALFWGNHANRLYKITSSDILAVAEVGESIPNQHFDKIRVVGENVFFSNKGVVYKYRDSDMSLKTIYNFVGRNHNFAVDNDYVFTADGVKIKYDLNIISNIFPEVPDETPANKQRLLEYKKMLYDFHDSRLEVSTDPLDKYIYCATFNDRILRVLNSVHFPQCESKFFCYFASETGCNIEEVVDMYGVYFHT